MEQITIAGQTVNVPVRYAEGHELTEGEASALNQTYHENIRNNLAKKVKEAVEAGAFDLAAFQAEVDAYAQSYQFGVRAAGVGVSRDPVRAEALNLAKAQIREALKKANRKAEPKAIAEAAAKLLDSPRGAPLLEAAKKRVEEKQAIAGSNLDDILGDLSAPAEAA